MFSIIISDYEFFLISCAEQRQKRYRLTFRKSCFDYRWDLLICFLASYSKNQCFVWKYHYLKKKCIFLFYSSGNNVPQIFTKQNVKRMKIYDKRVSKYCVIKYDVMKYETFLKQYCQTVLLFCLPNNCLKFWNVDSVFLFWAFLFLQEILIWHCVLKSGLWVVTWNKSFWNIFLISKVKKFKMSWMKKIWRKLLKNVKKQVQQKKRLMI